MPKDPQFNQMIYGSVKPETAAVMQTVEKGLPHARGVVEKMEQSFELNPQTDPRALHNMYMDAIFTSSFLKNYLLNASIVRSVNEFDFLSYALAGRSLIEITATLRYYLNEQIMPIVDASVKRRTVKVGDLVSMIEIEDRLLRGGRFDWLSFLSRDFDGLEEAYTEKLAAKKQKPIQPRSNSNSSIPAQVNTQTCIDKWASTVKMAGVIYDLFCDMVHPNVGSTLCIATSDTQRMALKFSFDQREGTGLQLFDRSYPLLQALAGKEFSEIVGKFVLLKMPINGES